MTILHLPVNIAIQSSQFSLESNTSLFESPLNRMQQVVERAGTRWRAQYTLAASNRAQAAEMQAFLMALRGRSGRFYAYDPDGVRPRGAALGTPKIKEGAHTVRSVQTEGWLPNTQAILCAGDYVQFGQQLVMLTQEAASDAKGEATLHFEPALRRLPSGGDVFQLEKAACIMRLEDDEQAAWHADERGVYQLSFQAVEVFSE